METGVIVALTTAASSEQAEAIASALVAERLAACVNVIRGIASVYRWKGEVARDEESLLVIKTTASLLDSVRRRIRELHSYELPECLALAVADGDGAYLDWVRESVGSPPPPPDA